MAMTAKTSTTAVQNGEQDSTSNRSPSKSGEASAAMAPTMATAAIAAETTTTTPSQSNQPTTKTTTKTASTTASTTTMMMYQLVGDNHTDPASKSRNSTALSQCPAPGSPDCDEMLETIDSCVGCVEGISMQHQFEDAMVQDSIKRRQIAAAHGLSEAEATMVRQQITNASALAKLGTQLPDLVIDLDALCGTDEILITDTAGCGVTPSDTTMSAEMAGDRVVPSEPRQKSLVDAENDVGLAYDVSLVDDFGEPGANRQCMICLDEAGQQLPGSRSPRKIAIASYPCCEDAPFQICTACVLVLTTASSDGSSRLGRCLNCAKWIAVTTLHAPNTELVLSCLDVSGRCELCQMDKDVIIEKNPPTCDACFLTKKTALEYECKECHSIQTIAYPMYRHQPSLDEFGTKTWECQNASCQKQSYWRLRKDQSSRILACDYPVSWENEAMQLAQDKVKAARMGIAKLSMDTDGNTQSPSTEDACVIL